MIINREALLNAARQALDYSYSPYSKFKVGAAIVTEDGRITTGVNVENASYGLSICAERSAIFSAISSGHSNVLAIAVACQQATGRRDSMPCGACLQVIAEFAEPSIPILVDGVGEFKLCDLLPVPFQLQSRR